MSVRSALALVLALIACAHGDDLQKQVEGAQAVEASQRAQTDRLTVDAAQLLGEYEAVTARFADAEARYRAASQAATGAAESFTAAESSYTDAERNWRWMTYVIIAAATWDVAGEVCANVESTRSYRQRLGLDRSVCVDHSFAHALGGVNSPWNYMPLDCRVNSAYGASFWSKFVAMPIPMLRGLAASALARLRCGGKAGAWSR